VLLSKKRAGILPAILLLPLLLPACSLLPARPAADDAGMLLIDAQGRMQRVETATPRSAQLPDDGTAPPRSAQPPDDGAAGLPAVPESARTGARNAGAINIDPAQYRTSEEMDVELARRADERFVMVPGRDGTTLRPVPVSQLTEDSAPAQAPPAELPLLPPDAAWPQHLAGCSEPDADAVSLLAPAGKARRKAVRRFPVIGPPLARVPIPDGSAAFRLATVVRGSAAVAPAVVLADERLRPLAAGYATLTMTVPESAFAYAQLGRTFVIEHPEATWLLLGAPEDMAAYLARVCPDAATARAVALDESFTVATGGQVILEFIHAEQQ
jgi:hypothetical protein